MKYLSSIKLGLVLILLYIISVATATFIENDYGTPAARWLIYKSLFFSILHFLLVLNVVLVFIKYRLFRLKKLSVVMFHAAFVLIILGAAITRFLSYEGLMHIRVGQSSHTISSYDSYLNIKIEEGDKIHEESILVNFNPLNNDNFSANISFDNEDFRFDLIRFIPNAAERIVKTNEGQSALLSLNLAVSGTYKEFVIQANEFKTIEGNRFFFGSQEQAGAINIKEENGQLFINNPEAMKAASMSDTSKWVVEAKNYQALKEQVVYSWGKNKLLVKQYLKAADVILEAQNNEEQFPDNALALRLQNKDKEKIIHVFGRESYIGKENSFILGQRKISLSYGAKEIEIPFTLFLKQFKLERYPGSMSPSSYESLIVLNDTEENIEKEQRIYMNNVLTHRGYRFYQSSYDTDEQGTILSVNKDYWGTQITYLGYFLLALGMFLNIFDKNSRFRQLSRKVKALRVPQSVLMLFLVFSLLGLQSSKAQTQNIDPEHAKRFAHLLVQDQGGRVEPINTLAHEVLRKVSRRSTYKDLSANQVLLSMLANTSYWAKQALVKVTNPDIIKKYGIRNQHISLAEAFGSNNNYLLGGDVQRAYAKVPARQTSYDKDIIKLDEKINVLYLLLNKDLLNIYPLRNSSNQKWYNPNNKENLFKGKDSLFVNNVLNIYLEDVRNAQKTNNWAQADSSLNLLKLYQEKIGKKIIPAKRKLEAEIFYNESALFRHLFEFYFIAGMAFLTLLFISLLFTNLNLGKLEKGFTYTIFGAFIIHTLGLILRWYIAGHAPWSNGYESMIYLSWASMLAGFIFGRETKMALAATTLLSGTILLVAHLSWIDPEITHLVPVLQSYWLTIHVAVIIASYGFLSLGALLGFINLIFILLKTETNRLLLDKKIKQLTYINEMSLIAGLFLLSIGTFLGGVWANESWGRYWGWDAKETWALISMLVYAALLHIRFIPRLKGVFTFNYLSIWAVSSIIMTYFGVNYYLSGLHSYAKGDPVPIPHFVYYSIVLLIVIGIAAHFKNRKMPIKAESETKE